MKNFKFIAFFAGTVFVSVVHAQMAFPNAHVGLVNYSDGGKVRMGFDFGVELVMPVSKALSLSTICDYKLFFDNGSSTKYEIISPVLRVGVQKNLYAHPIMFGLGMGNSTLRLKSAAENSSFDGVSTWNQHLIQSDIYWGLNENFGLSLCLSTLLPQKKIPSSTEKTNLIFFGLKYFPGVNKINSKEINKEKVDRKIKGLLTLRIGSVVVNSNRGFGKSTTGVVIGVGGQIRVLPNMNVKLLLGNLALGDTKEFPNQRSLFIDVRTGIRLFEKNAIQMSLNGGFLLSKRTLRVVIQYPSEKTYLFLTRYAEIELLLKSKWGWVLGFSHTALNRSAFDSKPTGVLLSEKNIYSGLQFYF